ncbi:MAG: histidine phosphatase family protein [Chlamydiales bacterium]|nr:histidine phosphatase family protein [Chlamydiales bacterium]
MSKSTPALTLLNVLGKILDMPTILFESHSTSNDNAKGIASGWNDPYLSLLGEQQAKELGNRYSKEDISTIYVSDFIRSSTTAKLAFENRNIPIIQDVRLREWNYGDFNGSSVAEVRRLKKKYIESPFPNGESLFDVLERFSSFKNEYFSTFNETTVLIIGHRGTYYALEYFLNKTSLDTLLSRKWCWQPGWSYS